MSTSNSGRRTSFAGRQALLSLAVVGIASPAFAAPATFLATSADGTFANGVNWDTGTAPGAVGTTNNADVATFGRNGVPAVSNLSSLAVTVDANRNLQNITFNPTVAGSTTFGYAFTGGPFTLTDGGAITTGGTGLASTSFATPLNLAGSYTISADFTSTNRVLTISGAITGSATTGNASTLTLTGGSGGTHAISGAITNGANGGALAVLKTGANTWQPTGTANTYTGGTMITGGTLIGASATPASNIGTGAVMLNGGTLRLSGTTSTLVNAVVMGSTGGTISTKGSTLAMTSLTGTGPLTLTADAASVVTPSNNSFGAYAGTVNVGGGFTLRLGTSLTNFDAANAFAGLVFNLSTATSSANRGFATNSSQTVNIGTLTGVAGSTLSGGTVAGTGTFTYSVGARNESSTFAGNLTTNLTKAALAKVGNGALTLTGTNTYTGGTTISGGSIVTGSASALGTGNVGVTAGTLRVGDGTNNTVGGLTGLAMTDFTTLALAVAQSPSVGNVVLTSGLFTLGNITLDLNNQYGANGSYIIVDGVDGANALGTTTFANGTAGKSYALAIAGNDAVLTVITAAAVPEPTTLAALGLAGFAFASRRRRA